MKKPHFHSYLTQAILVIALTLFGQNTFAETNISIATAAHNLTEPLSFFTHTIYNICYILAIVLLISTITQYRAHRLNPNQTPLSRPIVLLILTLLTALVPLLAKLSESAQYASGI